MELGSRFVMWNLVSFGGSGHPSDFLLSVMSYDCVYDTFLGLIYVLCILTINV